MAAWEYDNWDSGERALFDDLTTGHPGAREDDDAQFYFHEAMFNLSLSQFERAEIRHEMIDYFDDEYLIDFYDEFDWVGYREWYESAA